LTNFQGDEAKKNLFFEKKNQNGRLKKKLSFSKSPIFNIFTKISEICPWVRRID
jgi:hypothetical protein